ncbi:hypothetical protein ABZ835_18800 [Streptomyces sp. NPDC047461]|uniref:hypothetical protein n=1 Tax=Streptomyces sp. NPDC047461 TaxID=3155619 RepID=UPI00340E04C5
MSVRSVSADGSGVATSPGVYAGLTGKTVQLDPPQPNTIDTVQGIASLDTGRNQAQVLLGGTSGDVNTVIRNVPARFGKKVNVTVERIG